MFANNSTSTTTLTGESTTEQDYFFKLLIAKSVTLLVLGIASFILGIIPIKLVSKLSTKVPTDHHPPVSAGHCHSHDDHQSLLVSVLLCFGGGVLLFTTFLHLGPEVRENMEELKSRGILPEFLANDDLHLADLIFCAGFFLVYFIDEAAHGILDSTPHVLEEEAILHRTMSLRKCTRHHDFAHRNNYPQTSGTMIPRVTLNTTASTIPDSSLLSVSTASRQVLLGGENGALSNSLRPGSVPPTRGPVSDVETDDSTISDNGTKSFRGLFAILALSFHEIFEGLAVGLETNVQNVWYLFAAIATHKLVLSFTMGIDLVSTHTKTSLIIMYIFCFAVVTPIGILAGIGLLHNDDGSSAENTLITFILQGISSGTLLYVTFFEVLRRERTNAKAGFLQLIAVASGFLLMLLLQILSSHPHSHGGHVHSHSGHVHHEHDHHDHDSY